MFQPSTFKPFEIRIGPEPGEKRYKVHPEARCYKSIRSMLGLYRNDNKKYEIEIRVRESDSPGGSCQAEANK